MKVNKAQAVIIVAGGSGSRMGMDVPKQFLLLKGKPILMHTIEVFYEYSSDIQIVVVLPEAQLQQWDMLTEKYHFTLNHQIAIGGSERFYSVKNGLTLVDEGRFVAVHDGVRPLVSLATIKRTFELAERENTAVPVVEMVESIREITPSGSHSVPRSHYKLVQTPQVFEYKTIMSSYDLPYNSNFTDDASVVEFAGYAIHLTEGNRENIKLTTPTDLLFAEALAIIK